MRFRGTSSTGKPPSNRSTRRLWITFACAFVGGYLDAVGYLTAKAFAGHITGNTVLLAISLLKHDWSTFRLRGLAVVCFVAGIVISALIVRPLKGRATPRTEALGFALEAGILTTAVLISLFLRAHWASAVFLTGAAIALGVQDGVLRKTRGSTVHTTFISGMVTSTVIGSAETITRDQPQPRLKVVAGVWLIFIIGALAGGLAQHAWGKNAAWPPIALLAACAIADLM